MESEILRVGFEYVLIAPSGTTQKFPMELWSEIVGVEDDPQTLALTPKIGWFVRESDGRGESLDRLKGANKECGIDLTIDEVPTILNEIDRFNYLTLRFKGKIVIPDWLMSKQIEHLILEGEISKEYESLLKATFADVTVYGH